jgi:hypothetical protein
MCEGAMLFVFSRKLFAETRKLVGCFNGIFRDDVHEIMRSNPINLDNVIFKIHTLSILFHTQMFFSALN